MRLYTLTYLIALVTFQIMIFYIQSVYKIYIVIVETTQQSMQLK